jgi:predicted amidohydrolase
MATWKVAGVQMDCRLGDVSGNLEAMRSRLHAAADQGARLIVFPECVLPGYCFTSRDEALPHAQPLPGPASQALSEDCRQRDVFVIAGLLERGPGGELFNSALLVGPSGLLATYRKIHLPFLGVDRFTTPGDRPLAVHDLGGLRVGMNICYDASFPEAARCLMLLGTDLVVLPTNWPIGASTAPRYLVPARAVENHLYVAAVDRVGEERGVRFIGQSQIVGCDGEILAKAGDQEALVVAEIDPELARNKKLVKIPGEYELDRLGDRRPELYGAVVETPRSRAARP